MRQGPVVLTVLTVVGAAYLIWLGVMVLVRPSVPQEGEGEVAASSARWATKGFGVSALNPKVFLLFLALLPQFTQPGAGRPLSLQIVVLGAIHMLSCALVYTGVGAGARHVLGTRPAAARAVSRVSGTAMVLIGVVLLVERLFLA